MTCYCAWDIPAYGLWADIPSGERCFQAHFCHWHHTIDCGLQLPAVWCTEGVSLVCMPWLTRYLQLQQDPPFFVNLMVALPVCRKCTCSCSFYLILGVPLLCRRFLSINCHAPLTALCRIPTCVVAPQGLKIAAHECSLSTGDSRFASHARSCAEFNCARHRLTL